MIKCSNPGVYKNQEFAFRTNLPRIYIRTATIYLTILLPFNSLSKGRLAEVK